MESVRERLNGEIVEEPIINDILVRDCLGGQALCKN